MPVNDFQLTIEDFEKTNWQQLIEDSGEKQIRSYIYAFNEAANNAKTNNDEKTYGVFNILRAVTSLFLLASESEQSFSYIDGSPADLNTIFGQEELLILKEILPSVTDLEMIARMSDIIFVGLKDYHTAPKAIEAYLNCSSRFHDLVNQLQDQGTDSNHRDSEYRIECLNRIRRAFQISKQTGNKKLTNKLIAYVDSVLDTFTSCEPNILANKFLGILLEQKSLNPTRISFYADLAEKCALYNQNDDNWTLAINYWTLQAKFKAKLSDIEGERKALINAAETLLIGAEAALKRSAPSHLAAAGLIGQAMNALQKIGGTEARREELYKKMLEHQEEGKSEFGHFSVEEEIDVSTAINLVKGKGLDESLDILASINAIPFQKVLEEEVDKLIKNPSLSDIFPKVTFSDNGKVVAIVSSITNSDDKLQQAARQAKIFSMAREFQQNYAVEYLHPMARQIFEEHSLQIEDILYIVTNNPIIPTGREQLYAKGFYFGFNGDFVSAIHLLIPQFENSLRHLLWKLGLVTSYPKDDGSQAELNLNNLLYQEYGDKLKEIWGEDIIIDLRGLLVEKYGSNLRNDVMHGLADFDQLSSAISTYTWWIIFRIVYMIYKLNNEQTEPEPTIEPSSNNNKPDNSEGITS